MSKIAFLGFASNSFSENNNVSFIYKNEKDMMLVDCGASAIHNIHSVVDNLAEINYCFVSHSHYDHFLGLPYFLIGRNLDVIAQKKRDPNYKASVLNIVISKPLRKLISILQETCHPDVKSLNYPIKYIDMDETTNVQASMFELHIKKMSHSVETYGFSLFEEEEKILSYSADTLYNQEIINFFKGSHYLIVEGMVSDSEDVFSKTAKHATFGEAVKVFQEVNPDYAFVVHLQPRYFNRLNEINQELSIKGNNRIGFPQIGEWYDLLRI